MNPYKLENARRLKKFAEMVLDSVRVAEHNALVERRIMEKGDPTKFLAKQYEQPRFRINNLFVLAQITDDDDHSPWEQETYNLKEGGPVEFCDDGFVGTTSDFDGMGGVLCW